MEGQHITGGGDSNHESWPKVVPVDLPSGSRVIFTVERDGATRIEGPGIFATVRPLSRT